MPFTPPSYPMLTPEQVNPYHLAIQTALQQMQQVPKSVYAAPMAQQEMVKALQANQWNPKIWQSEIGLRGAQSGLAGAEAAKQRFLVNNPQYINPAGMLIGQAMRNGQGGGQMSPGMGAQPQQGMPQGGNVQVQGGQPPMQQSIAGGAQGGQQGQQGYDPSAMAYNPPQIGSPTGNQGLDAFYYKTFGMNPQVQAQMDIAQKQAQKNIDMMADRNNELNAQANASNESSMNANQFLSAADEISALQVGPIAGRGVALQDASQRMDKAHARMTESAARMFKPGQAIHDSDLALENIATPSRLQNLNVSAELAHGIIAKNDRNKEQQLFYAYGNSIGLKAPVLDAMWNKFQTDRPYINTETYMPNDAYKGSWKDYLSPQAVNAYLRGKEYTPTNQHVLSAMNWNEKDLKKIQQSAKARGLDPKDFSKKALYEWATEEKKSMSGLKMEFMQRGYL